MAAAPTRPNHCAAPHVRPPRTARRIAVIGAGAAGLVAARELRREGHSIVVFERAGGVGGTWIYDAAVESDPLSVSPRRRVVHTSLYESLRTNLPRECMGFLDYPFLAKEAEDGRDRRRFPGHGEVLRYLEDFARDFDLRRMIRFETEVSHVGMADDDSGGGGWTVRSRRADGDGEGEEETSEVYDGVVVCNGHYTSPRVAEIPGTDTWPGKQMHSHNYRVPEPFRDLVVVLIGGSASAVDISRDIAKVAKAVHVASRSAPPGTELKQPGYDNMWLRSMIESAHEDGTVVFEGGGSMLADVILHCTGYKYHFPFLETKGIVTVDDNRVGPLYKHIFPPLLAPWISFIGLPWKVAPFPLFELQSKWVAGVLSGRMTLPTQQEMMDDVNAFYSELESSCCPQRYTHNLSNYQFDYKDWLSAACGCESVEDWRRQMYVATSKNRVARPETYRDEWEDDHLVIQAHEDFQRQSKVHT